MRIHTLSYFTLNTVKSTTTDKQDILGIYMYLILMLLPRSFRCCLSIFIMVSEGWSSNISSTFSIRHILLCFMVSHLLFWTVFKNSQTSLWKQKQTDSKTACEFPEDLRDARIGNEGCREMLLSSLADRTYLYEDHFHTLINNSDKHGRSSKHEAVEVERCFESMNGSEKMSSEAPSGWSSIE